MATKQTKRGRKPGSKTICSVCGKVGHNKRTCPGNKEKNVKVSSLPAQPTQEQIVEVLKKAESYDLNQTIWRLLSSEPFFAAISRRIDKRSSMNVPTAGVRFNEKTLEFEMLYNPVFMSQLTDNQQQDVIKHEYFHIILDHCTGRQPPGCKENPSIAKQWNYATDLAINSHLDNLPEGCLKPGADGPCKSIPSGHNAEWYYENMPEEMKQMCQGGSGQPGEGNEGGQGQGQFDDHSNWNGKDQMSDASKEYAREKMKDISRKAANEAGPANSWGTISSSMRDEILRNLYSTVDWKKVLRCFVKTSQKANKSSSIRRINKRYPYIHSGKKVNRTAKLAICIDESGSVGNTLLARFFGELTKLAEIAEFTVIPFDHEVSEENIYVWKKGSKHLPKRVLTGGTCFDAPTKYVNEHNFDGVIILTDMCAPKPGPCKVQRLWATDENSAKNPYFNPSSNERIIGIKNATNSW